MITKKQFREHIQNLKKQMHIKKNEIKEIEEKIEAIKVLLGSQKSQRRRKGIHLEIKRLIRQKGPQTTSELTNELVHSGKLVSKQPRVTVYHSLRRRDQDFYQDENKEWHLKDNVEEKTSKILFGEEDEGNDNADEWEENIKEDEGEEDAEGGWESEDEEEGGWENEDEEEEDDDDDGEWLEK